MHLWIWKYSKLIFMWSSFWSILVCKISQFLAKSYRLGQLIILFWKVDALRLLKIYIYFFPSAEAKCPFLGTSPWMIRYNKWISSSVFKLGKEKKEEKKWNGKTISEYNVKRGGWSKIPNFGCFFIWSIECLQKTDFVQLIKKVCLMIMRTHFNTVTQLRINVKSVWHILTWIRFW